MRLEAIERYLVAGSRLLRELGVVPAPGPCGLDGCTIDLGARSRHLFRGNPLGHEYARS